LEATEIKSGDGDEHDSRKIPNANLDIGTVRKFTDGLDARANSDVPSIAPKSIEDQRTETISLSEQFAGRVEP
jgi:hypothetical protein